MSLGVDSAKPNISDRLAGFPVGEWLMVAVSLYRPIWGLGTGSWNVWSNFSGLTPPGIGTFDGPSGRPVIVPGPPMLLLYSVTTQEPATAGVSPPVSCEV